MRLIATKLGPTDKSDSLTFLRSDGSSARIPLPRQGILPHDLVHFVVESALPLPHWKDALLFGLSVAVAVLAAKVAGRF